MILVAVVIAAAVAAGVATQRRHGERAARLSQRILAAMLSVLVPPVVFLNLAHLEFTTDIGVGIVLAWISVLVAGLVAYAVGTRLLHLERPQQGTLINTTLHPNTGYLGLPVCAAALGTDSLDRAIAYDTLVGTPTLLLAVFAVGAAFGTKAGETRRERARAFVARNPPLLAAVLGLLAPSELAPDALVDASRVLVFALLPIGFYAVGIVLAGEGHIGRPDRTLATALGLRLLLAPGLLLLLALPLIDLPDPYLVAAAMPTGVNGLVVAHAYGLDVGLQASAVAYGTTLVVLAGVIITLVT